MTHSPYSAELVPSDYSLNDYMKRNLIDEANEKCLARTGIEDGEKYFRRRIFEKLLERMKRCINNHGDYFEHLIK